MNSSNCLNHCQLGSLYSDEGLVEAATSYFCRNFEAVSQSQHFLENATVDDLAYFLENETITVKDESIILNTVISWTNFDLENRANNFENLLPFVQWDQLSAPDLENFQNQFPKHKGELLIKYKIFKKIAWIRSHHLHFQSKFKLMVGNQKFFDNAQQYFAFTPQAKFLANN